MEASSAYDGASETPSGNGSGDAGFGGSDTTAPSAGLGPTDNAVILVHAAGLGAYRVCFDSALSGYPLPDRQTMPEANVVGVDVGTAVRLAPIPGLTKRAYVFEESAIRKFTTPGGVDDYTCTELVNLASDNIPKPVAKLDMNASLGTGVHLVVLSGCGPNPPAFDRTTAQCGPDFDGTKGNLKIQDVLLTGSVRSSDGALPTQVFHAAQALEFGRGTSEIAVTFGDLGGAGNDTPVVKNPQLLGPPAPQSPVSLAFDPTDTAVYAKRGFTVTLGGKKLFSQSLADVARLSSPSDLPTTYYAVASNYVLLLLGDPNAASKGDAGPDQLEALHFLVVPVVEPKADAGTAPDGGPL